MENRVDMTPSVRCVFDNTTNTASYIVADAITGRAAVIDPLLDLDPDSGRYSTESIDRIVSYVRGNSLAVDWILETHIHADHVSGAQFVKRELGGRIGIGCQVLEVQQLLTDAHGYRPDVDRSGFDVMFEDEEEFRIGSLTGLVLSTPGHTPACVTYVIGDACFVGDTLFMPDSGTARCDFPGGDARQLYASIQRIFELPGETGLFVCHDYGANGQREFAWETTVAEQRENNIHMGGGTLEHDFVAMRCARDRTLELPRLFYPSIRENIKGGPCPDDTEAE